MKWLALCLLLIIFVYQSNAKTYLVETKGKSYWNLFKYTFIDINKIQVYNIFSIWKQYANEVCQKRYLHLNISDMKLSITSLYIISDAPKYHIIWTENSDVMDSFVSEILKYKSWILASWRKRSWTVRFTPN